MLLRFYCSHSFDDRLNFGFLARRLPASKLCDPPANCHQYVGDFIVLLFNGWHHSVVVNRGPGTSVTFIFKWVLLSFSPHQHKLNWSFMNWKSRKFYCAETHKTIRMQPDHATVAYNRMVGQMIFYSKYFMARFFITTLSFREFFIASLFFRNFSFSTFL